MSQEETLKKKKVRRRSATSASLNQHAKRPHKRRSSVDVSALMNLENSNNNDESELLGAYKKGDIVLTKDTAQQICVIKTIRNQNGLQYGIVCNGTDSNIRYMKPGKIIKQISIFSVIDRIETLNKMNVCQYVTYNLHTSTYRKIAN